MKADFNAKPWFIVCEYHLCIMEFGDRRDETEAKPVAIGMPAPIQPIKPLKYTFAFLFRYPRAIIGNGQNYIPIVT